MIYLDYAASTPVSEAALEAFTQLSRHYFANANSLHDLGTQTDAVLSYARQQLAGWLGNAGGEIFFTDSGSQANLYALLSLAKALPAHKKHILISQMEHSSVLNAAQMLMAQGYHVETIAPNRNGEIDEQSLISALRAETGLVSIQHVNSETGIIQPLARLSAILKRAGVLLHTDAVQSFSKLDASHSGLGADVITLAGHKVYAPKGVGVVSINANVPWQRVFPGNHQQRGFYPGTINVPLIGAFVAACEQLWPERERINAHVRDLRAQLVAAIRTSALPIELFDDSNASILPGIFGAFYQGLPGQYVMLESNRYGICIATGSACRVGLDEMSPTLKALGYRVEKAAQFFRVSFGKDTQASDITAFVSVLEQLRPTS
ncbi:IscS subfamily cysteine desulfurase [Celerinatantimonas diazotrophica]|uniref:Cysteine desulfurase n=1 Tax=Celerinatantimonas diazotrophica TaxID=412034 RepID=A0A4R1J9G1_9GAMM|nr:IscS subfamily cysteine desulfurase [Celerinatantimonas diazotrophica]TCK46739.1 cysteine desulfurase [Celerinatantimonas diazotrophica]CAG9295441.1 Putative cysteine desulfurase NifS [Celerinatantimonas diazotrophica]